MATHHKHTESTLSLVDAVETLSNIADLDFDRQIGVTQVHALEIQDEKAAYRTVHWLNKEDPDYTVTLVKETFKVILKYLRNFYKNEYSSVTDQGTLERIKTIMVLVGEAAKKLDKFTTLFQAAHKESITTTREYKDLQEFYLRKISRTIDEGVLGKWILALTKQTWERKPHAKLHVEAKAPETTRVFVDLDSVKKDTEYELFNIRKEDGSRFFNPKLIRNIKLVCDFGAYFGQTKEEDPLLDLQVWQDRYLHNVAKKIIKDLKPTFDRFYQEAFVYRDNPLVAHLSHAIMAIMLAANPSHLWNHTPKKYAKDYFADFQLFLRDAMHTREYQKLIAYAPDPSDKVGPILLKTVHALCRELYQGAPTYLSIGSSIHHLVEEAIEALPPEQQKREEVQSSPAARLARDHAALVKLIRHHPNGPLNKVLEIIEAGGYKPFDTLLQDNLPQSLYDIKTKQDLFHLLRIPSPTSQEFINKAHVVEEFKGFLRSLNDQAAGGKHLLFNLQDRSSWREFFRSQALEEIQSIEDFAPAVTTVTLAVDSDFYHQLTPYHEDTKYEDFKSHLLAQVKDELCGFYFPHEVSQKITMKWIERLVEAIHTIFFGGRNVLSRERRLDFIDLFYMFLELKVVELVNPASFSFTCKDGIDTGMVNSAGLYFLLKAINGQSIKDEELDALEVMLYGPALMIRERLILPERFNRMVSTLKLIESLRDELGSVEFPKAVQETCGPLFDTPILQALPVFPKAA